MIFLAFPVQVKGCPECPTWDSELCRAPAHCPRAHVHILDAGVPALSNDAGEASRPSGVHLNPLGLRLVLSTPCPVIVVIFIGTSLLEGRLSTGRRARAHCQMDSPLTHLHVEPAPLGSEAVAQHGRGADLVVLDAM